MNLQSRFPIGLAHVIRLHRAVGGPGIAANLPSTAPPAPSPATALENLNATVNP